jgi:hypothetical protein
LLFSLAPFFPLSLFLAHISINHHLKNVQIIETCCSFSFYFCPIFVKVQQ